MKKTILTLTAFACISGAFFTGCSSSADKVENAQDNVNAANKDLDKANREYLADIENYKKQTAEKIAANDKSASDFKARIANQKQDAKTDYTNKIAALEQQNTDMKLKMDDYKADTKDNWETFKAAYDRDMDNLGKSIQSLVDKVK